MDFWDNIAAVYDAAESLNGKVYNEMTELVKRLVPKGAEVLDCAAGTGSLSVAAAKKAHRVVCTDLSENMLFRACKKAKRHGADNIVFEKRNIFELCDKDGTYDCVIAGNVLHLLDNPQGAVRELCRVTKSGGKVILPTFTWENREHFLVKMYRLIGFKPKKGYTPESYYKMLRDCGVGRVKMKLIDGMVLCCMAVIYVNKKG